MLAIHCARKRFFPVRGSIVKRGIVAAAFFVPGLVYLIHAQTAQTSTQTGQQTPHVRGAAAEAPSQRSAYPDRPGAPQDILDRGKAVYGVNCAFCHGSDAAGGEVGPNLLRSGVVLDDQNGELIAPIVHGARVNKGMPHIDITDAQITDIATWLHSLKVVSFTVPPEVPINIVTGNATAGQTFFQKTCASCHSVTGDLKGLATRIPDPRALQQAWLLPGGGGGRRPNKSQASTPGLHVPPTSVTVILPDGQEVEGELTRIDDFYVGLKKGDGTLLGFTRSDNTKVELHDPLAPHRELLRTYTDKNIHDVTAYLVTIK
jgi:cytochrome c oxidase cbb3-type subunit III